MVGAVCSRRGAAPSLLREPTGSFYPLNKGKACQIPLSSVRLLGHRTIDPSSSFVHHGTGPTRSPPVVPRWVFLFHPWNWGLWPWPPLTLRSKGTLLIAGWWQSGPGSSVNLSVPPVPTQLRGSPVFRFQPTHLSQGFAAPRLFSELALP